MISVPRGTEMFQFPRCPLVRYGLADESWVMKPTGLPHSEIPGYASTRLTEAYRSVATSFIGPRRPGIHPAPILVCANVDQGFGPLPARMRAVNGMRTASLATTPLSRLAGPARRGQGRTQPRQPLRRQRAGAHRPKKMMSTKTYVVGKVHRREAPRGGATGPVNHRSAPVSAGADRGSLGGIKL